MTNTRNSLMVVSICGVIIGIAVAESNCPPNTIQKYALAMDTSVTAVFDSDSTPFGTNSSENNDAINGVYDGLGSINYSAGASGNDTGTTFTNIDSDSNQPTTSAPIITIQFDTTTTSPPGGDVASISQTQYNLSNGMVASSVVTVYLASTSCGGACFDPSQSSFSSGVSTAVQHELTHLLGIGDADTLNNPSTNANTVMGVWSGVNNTGYLANGAPDEDLLTGTQLPPMASSETGCDDTTIDNGDSSSCHCR